jgi:hypothetical protein
MDTIEASPLRMQFASECRTPVDSKLIRIQKLTGDVDRVIPPRGNRHCKNRFKGGTYPLSK